MASKLSGRFCMMINIDLVIPWVDGSDPAWLEEKNKYLKHKSINSGFYQDHGTMRYWFRCVEKNMPWIRYVFFITWGHTPEWLVTDHPKLKIINHKDYLPNEFIPTFNPNPLNLNLHRIKELSEHFIYAEDDIFFLGKQCPEDFFSDEGLPKDYLWLRPITEQFDGDFAHIMLNNLMFINRHFSMKNILPGSEDLLFSSAYPEKVKEDNNKLRSFAKFPGFKESHLAYAFLKSSFEEVWKMYAMPLYISSMHKFRSISDLTNSVVRDYQLVKGKFVPFYPKGRYFRDTASADLADLILDPNTSMICINESAKEEGYPEQMRIIKSCLEQKLPIPSSFEKY